jgi:hypothetical protein
VLENVGYVSFIASEEMVRRFNSHVAVIETCPVPVILINPIAGMPKVKA